MSNINPRLLELLSMAAFALGMNIIFGYVNDCDLKALILMVYTAVYCIWLTNRTNNIK